MRLCIKISVVRTFTLSVYCFDRLGKYLLAIVFLTIILLIIIYISLFILFLIIVYLFIYIILFIIYYIYNLLSIFLLCLVLKGTFDVYLIN